MKKVFKQSLICILSVMLSVTMFPVYAFAEGGADPADTAEVMEAEFPDEFYSEEEPLDNYELFTLYAESVLYGDAENEAPLLRGRNNVPEGLNGIIYSKLKEEVALVANGTNNSTAFELSLADLGLAGKTWTAKDLGVDAIVANGAISQEAVRALQASLGVDLNVIMGALLADCPYELYWYDKTVGVSMSGPRIGASYSGSEYVMTLNSGYIFSLAVAQGYSAGEYLVDTSGIERVHHAVDTAASIVNDASSENDYNKLYTYKDAICSRVSYNYDAAYDDSTPYGDPWQLISVFDDDTDTNIVCEGYSKAFQYLCDRTDFDGDINCISVSGYMGGGTGAGAHMWNIVTMEDGRNYLVDVTNCDDGTIGAPDQLFLAGYDSGSKDAGYVFNAGGTGISYTYGNDTLNLYDSELEIAGSDYEYHEWSEWTEVTSATCTEGGLEKRTCSLCGEEQTRVTEALGHDYVVAADTAIDPTCSEAGHEDDQVCTRCGDTIYGAEIAPLGHELTKVDAKEATETEEGNIEYWVCETCGKYFADSEGMTEISAESVVAPMVVPVVIASGSCGDNATFVLYEDGDFIVSGTGRISDFSLYDSYRNSIKNMVIEEGIEEIASYAFVNCKNLESVTIPQSLNIIEMDIFEGCNNLKRVDISDISKYVQIGNWGYFSPATCYGADLYLNGELVTDVVIPDDVEYVGSYAFCNCYSITSVTISEGVTSIGNDAFTFCTNLKKIIIPDSLIYIGFEAFFGCSSLESILIPESVTEIANVGAFGGCDNLKDIYVIKDSIADTWLAENGLSDKVKYVTKEDNHYYYEQIKSEPDCGHAGNIKYTCVSCGEEKNINIPATGNHVWDEGTVIAEPGCENAGLMEKTCLVCDEISTEDIPAIGHEWGDWSVIKEPTCIHEGTLSRSCIRCSLEEIENIPATGVHIWGEWAVFKEPTCVETGALQRLCNICGTAEYEEVAATGDHKTIHIDSIEPTSTEDGNIEYWYCEICGKYFSDAEGKNEIDQQSTIIPKFGPDFRWNIDDGVLTLSGIGKMPGFDYGNLSPWYSRKDEIREIIILRGLTNIGEMAFKDLTNVTSVTIPEGVKRIEEYAFSGCTSLTDINIPDSLYFIGECAFSNCSSLKIFPMHGTVTNISRGVFNGCTSLKTITIPDTVGYVETDNEYEWYNFDTIYVVKNSAADKYLSENPNLKKLLKYVTPLKGHYCYEIFTKATFSANGKIEYICSSCENKISSSVINKPATFTLSATSFTYSGGAIKPTVKVKDSKGNTIASSNYSVTYSNNINVGTATAKVTFKGDKYSGTKNLTYKINVKKITPTVTLSATSYTYDGKVKKPTVTVKDGATKLTTESYSVTYASGRKNVGPYKVTVTLKGNYSGTKTLTFKINPKGTTLKTLTATSKGFKATWTKQATKMSTSYITGYQIQYSTSSTFASGNTTVTVTKYSTVSKTISNLTAKKKYYVRIRTYKTVSGVKYYSPWSAKKYVTTKA